jgi:hypothetical protein
MDICLNRTQTITKDWLMQTGLEDEALLLEALLRRGFLAFRDSQRLWLGSGSHRADLRVLRLIDGLEINAVTGDPDKDAAVCIQSGAESRVKDIATEIIGLGEHHMDDVSGGFTSTGVAPHLPGTWAKYRQMVWGAKLAVCPATSRRQAPVNEALDLGIALLVKVLPLARVATSLSCDGHGKGPAFISLHFPWDTPWSEAIFQTLQPQTPNSTWLWKDAALTVEPKAGFGEREVLGMLNDIQSFARRLLNREVIFNIGNARARTIATLGADPPSVEAFAELARDELTQAFSKSSRPASR